MSEPPCPRCAGGGTVLWNERTRDALCRACGESFTLGDDDLSATTSATVERDLASFRDDPRVAALPVFLAAPLARVLAAPHPRVALHELADAAEMVVRWVTAVALAEVLATEGRDSLPASLLEELEEVPIERPTLGAWLALRNTLLRQLPEARALRSGLRPLEELWASCFAKGEDEGGDGTVATSLFVLRNRLAHGGAFHTEAAERLVPGHLERLEMLARGVSEATRGGELVGRHAGRTYSLVGPLPYAAPDLFLTQSLPASGLFLLDSSGQPLNLAPLLRFEPVVPTLGEPPLKPGDPVPQAYFRASRHAAQFTPLDGHHASSFSRDVTGLRRVFGLDRPRTASTAPVWLSECQARAADCLAREAELMHLKRWLKERDPRAALPRIAWLHGRPGSGKSTLVARVTADQANARPERQVVYHHAFLRGHWRCSRRAFLLGLEQALADWPQLEGVVDPTLETGADGERLRQSVVERLTAIVRLRSHDPRQPPPRALVVVDGLEEIAAVDPSFPGLLLELAPPGVLMLVVGQPDGALVEWARSPDVHPLFDGDGLPPLSVEGVRAVLRAEGIDVTAYDTDVGEDVGNPIVSRVMQLARGNPAFVRLLAADLRQRRSIDGGLPESLADYHAKLLERLGLSTARSDLTRILALAARAREALDVMSIAALCDNDPASVEDGAALDVEAAVELGAVMFARTSSREGDETWSLHDVTLREALNAAGRTHSRLAALGRAGERASRTLARAASWWPQQLPAGLRRHVLRHGVAYELDRPLESALPRLVAMLSNPDYLTARLQELGSSEASDLLHDLRQVNSRVSPPTESLAPWIELLASSVHWLRREVPGWSPDRALEQAALEHGGPEVRTAFLCRSESRPVRAALRRQIGREESPRRPRLLEGHEGAITGAVRLDANRLVSWSTDGTIRSWDLASGQCNQVAVPPGGPPDGVCVADGSLLTWSSVDTTITRWQGNARTALEGHSEPVLGVQLLERGRAVSWSADGGLCVWDVAAGQRLLDLRPGHVMEVTAVIDLGRDLLLSCSSDETAIVWDLATGEVLATLEEHTGPVLGGLRLEDGRLVTWSLDGSLALWDDVTFQLLARLHAHGAGVVGALEVGPAEVALWGEDGRVCVWDPSRGDGADAHRCMPHGHRFRVLGALRTTGDRLATWAREDPTVRLWNLRAGTAARELPGEGEVTAVATTAGWVASACDDATIRLWDPDAGVCAGVLTGHEGPVRGLLPLDDDRLVSWSDDGTLRLWPRWSRENSKGGAPRVFQPYVDAITVAGVLIAWRAGGEVLAFDPPWHVDQGRVVGRHDGDVTGGLALSDGRLATLSADRTVRVWDLQGVTPPRVLRGLEGEVQGVVEAAPGVIVGWSRGPTPVLWSVDDGSNGNRLEGHDDRVEGMSKLACGTLASWSRDGTVRLWSEPTGAEARVLRGHTGPILDLIELAADRIVTSSSDGTIRVWDVAEQREAMIWTCPGGAVEAMRPIRVDRVASWSQDRIIRVWELGTADPVLTLGPSPLPPCDVTPLRNELLVWTSRAAHLWSAAGDELESVPIAQVPATRPSWGLAHAKSAAPRCVSGSAYAWATERVTGIAWADAPERLVAWHGDGKPRPYVLSENGQLVAIEAGLLRILEIV